jgi:lysozyme
MWRNLHRLSSFSEGCFSRVKTPSLIKGDNMKTSVEGLALIKKFEGLELEAYQCAAGVWTIGYGHTKDVQPGDVWSESHANHMLEVELEEFEEYINDNVTVALSQNQFDALVSWVYNLGPANLKASTMLKVLNSGDYEGVPAQIKRWNKAGGKVLQGLIRRREAEALLFIGRDWNEV